MKKILSLCAAMVCACTMFAVQVTFDFSTAAGLSALGITPAAGGSGVTVTSLSLDGVNFVTDKGSASTDPRVWTATSGATDFRIYNGSTLTISGAQATDLITHIEMSGAKLNFTELANGQWTGSANSVTFTPTATCNVTTITITMNEEATEYIPDTISVTEAKALIDANDPLMHKGHFVKGVVAGDAFLLGANGPAFYMVDIANPADSLEGFKIAKDANNTAFADLDDMAAVLGAGDTILIYAAGLALYNNKIYETTSGYFAAMLGKSAAIILDWAVGNAYRETGKWALEIEKVAGNAQNVARLVFNSAVEDGIAGFHQLEAESALTVNGANIAIASGSVTLTFKEINTNGYNVYAVKMVAQAGDDMYRINRDIEFYAQNGDGDEIILIGDRPFVPKDGDTITCAQAREYILSLGSGESSPMTVTVRGFVTDMFSNGYTFWMDDKKGSAQTIQAYYSTMPFGVNVVEGTEVYVTGKLKNYNGTPEIDHGTVTVISGAEVVTVVEVTVSEAVAACQALEQNKVSAETYAITGYITEIAYEYSEQYGNISFWMSDNLNDNGQVFQAYRAKCEASIADKLVPGAKVKVTDKLKHFHQDATEGENPKPERTVYETNGGGTVELIAGAGVEDIFTNAPAVKVLENGQIYIIRGGVRYNLQGQIAE